MRRLLGPNNSPSNSRADAPPQNRETPSDDNATTHTRGSATPSRGSITHTRPMVNPTRNARMHYIRGTRSTPAHASARSGIPSSKRALAIRRRPNVYMQPSRAPRQDTPQQDTMPTPRPIGSQRGRSQHPPRQLRAHTTAKCSFEDGLKALKDALRKHPPIQSTREHRIALEKLYNQLYETVRPGITPEETEKYCTQLAAVAQQLYVHNNLQPIYKARQAFIEIQGSTADQPNHFQALANKTKSRLESLPTTQQRLEAKASGISSPDAMQSLEAEQTRIQQEALILRILLIAQDFLIHQLDANEGRSPENISAAQQNRQKIESLMSDPHALKVSNTGTVEPPVGHGYRNHHNAALMKLLEHTMEHIDATLLARNVLLTLQTSYQALEGTVTRSNTEDIAAHINSLIHNISPHMDRINSLLSASIENPLSLAGANPVVDTLIYHRSRLQLFEEVDQLSKALTNADTDTDTDTDTVKQELLNKCSQLKIKFTDLKKESRNSHIQTSETVVQLTSFYWAQFETVSRKVCLQNVDRIRQFLKIEHAKFDVRNSNTWGTVQHHKSQLEIAQISLEDILAINTLTPEQMKPVAALHDKLADEITLISSLANIKKSRNDFFKASIDASSIHLALNAIDFHQEQVTQNREISDMSDETLAPIQTLCEDTLMHFHKKVADLDAKQAILNSARARQVAKQTSRLAPGHKARLREALQRSLRILAKYAGNKDLLDPLTYNNLVTEKRECKKAQAKLEIALIREQLSTLINNIDRQFEPLNLSEHERSTLKDHMNAQVDRVLQQRSQSAYKVETLRKLHSNMDSALVSLYTQLIIINNSAHLKRENKARLAQWCSRLVQNGSALLANTSQRIIDFDVLVQTALKAIQTGSQPLTNDLLATLSDAGCTDWGSKVLIDMHAIILSHGLSDALAKHLKSARQQDAESRVKQLEVFIDKHRQDFVALLYYSAFQTATNNKEIVDPSNTESVEAYLLFYLVAKADFVLPGNLNVNHMGYPYYTIEHVLGGEDNAQLKYKTIQKILAGAQGPLKGHYLNQLSDFFNIHIWKNIIATLPGQAERDTQVQAKSEHLLNAMNALDDQLRAGGINSDDFRKQVGELNKRYHSLDNPTDETQNQYAERLMARIAGNGQPNTASAV